MHVPDRQQLEETYRGLSNEGILGLAADPYSLSDDARYVLDCELRRRSLGDEEIQPYREQRLREIAEAVERSRDRVPRGILHILLGPLGGSLVMFLYKSFRRIRHSKDALVPTGSPDKHK
jgi:hypothetical protein